VSKFSTHRIRAIAKKEVVEFVRDWRTIMAIIVIPLLMFPLLFILFPILLESEAAELDALELTVIVQSNTFEASMEQAIVGAGIDIVMEPLDNQSQLSEPGEDLERVRNGSVDAILRVEKDNSTWDYAILRLSTSERSNEAWNRLLDALNTWESEEVERRISDSGMDVNSTLNPLRWDGDVAQSDVATSGEQAGMVLSLFIPLVLADMDLFKRIATVY
jgi:sodium transport system permease protein